ncbi:hypothetical protein RSAG8_12198, partial [Rhizoctonia solani AG-8 WAC10335]
MLPLLRAWSQYCDQSSRKGLLDGKCNRLEKGKRIYISVQGSTEKTSPDLRSVVITRLFSVAVEFNPTI